MSLSRAGDLLSSTSFDFVMKLSIFGSIRFALQGLSQSSFGTFNVTESQLGLRQKKMGLRVFRFLLYGFAEKFPGLRRALIVKGNHSHIIQRAFMFWIEKQNGLIRRDGVASVALRQAKVSESEVGFGVVWG